MTVRVALYARYSSDLQSDASIEDQIRLCQEKAQAQGWDITECYTDAGLSGASLIRPGIQSLIQDAMLGKFDVVLAEAMDRLSRDQEDIAGIYKRMQFADVKIITLSEGEVNTMHIGLKGTMNALFLKDLADKTRRGLRGRIEKALSGGGIAYGYRVAKKLDASGEVIKGHREIDKDQAGVICRIFTDYANGKSPKAIAAQLNQQAIPGPSGKGWAQSTINGNRKRGTGILNNELYIGQLVWNRQHFIKNPDTGKRVTRMNPKSAWIRVDIPNLRIVLQELWDKAKARQKSLDKKTQGENAPWKQRRPRYLLSGLLTCGICKGGYSKISKEHYGCSAARNKGKAVCSNMKSIRRDVVENSVLGALQDHLMDPALVEVFCAEYTKHKNELHKTRNADLNRAQNELKTLDKSKQRIIEAIKVGMPPSEFKDEMDSIIVRRKALEQAIGNKSECDQPIFHPSMAKHYHKQVEALRRILNQEDGKDEAIELLRSLVEKIVLTPEQGRKNLKIDLYGSLAGILNIAAQKTGSQDKMLDQLKLVAGNDNYPELQVKLVAGVGFEPTTSGL